MTNTNVMVLNVQAAPVKGMDKSPLKGITEGSSKGNFDEALGRLQQEAQKEMASTGKDDTPQSKDTGDGGSGREGVPQNPLAIVMALPVQQTVPEEVPDEVLVEAPAAVVDFTEEAPISGDLMKAAEGFVPAGKPSEQNLRTLLPQSNETAVKNKDFLAMLSGDLTSGQRAEAMNRADAMMQMPPGRQMLQDMQVPQGRQMLQGMQMSQGMQIPQGMQKVEGMHPTEGMQLARGIEIPEGPEEMAPVLRIDIQSQHAGDERITSPWQVGQLMPDSEPRDPLGLALRQAARPVQREVQPEITSPMQDVRAEAMVMTEAEAIQPQLAAVAEMSHNKTESLQALMGGNISVETEPGLQSLQVRRGQESQGQAPFQQEQGKGNEEPQANFAAVLETEEVAVPTQVGSASHGLGAAQINAFQQQVQEAAVPNEPSPLPPQMQTDYEVPSQIVEQARLIRSAEDTEMVIHLKPEHLGDLTLKISVAENGAVNASFHSDNAQVRAIIENSLVQLRQELNNQGLKVESVEVFSGLPDGQLPQGQGQQAWQQGSQGRFAGERKPEDYVEEADDLAAAVLAQSQDNPAEDGVDYRI